MKDKPISDLRRRMLEDMASAASARNIKHIETFTRFLGRSPDAATAEDLRCFQIAFHGLNPAMGWLFAVALGLHRRSRTVVYLSLVPIGLAMPCPSRV
jgi:hypothetical protein